VPSVDAESIDHVEDPPDSLRESNEWHDDDAIDDALEGILLILGRGPTAWSFAPLVMIVATRPSSTSFAPFRSPEKKPLS
jgi:hypothetical protein